MSSLHSVIDNLAVVGSLYGWRVDAILLSALLWAVTAGTAQLRLTTR